jgi:hypothetical protein
MALQFLTGLDVNGNIDLTGGVIDLNKNQLQNAVIHKLSAPPSSPSEGQIYYDDSVGDKQPYFYDGTTWIPISGDIKSVKVTDDSDVAYNITSGDFHLKILGDTGISTAITNTNEIRIDLDDTAVTAGSYGSETLDIAADSGTDDGVRIGTDILTISGTANEISTSVSGDTITVALPDDVTIGNDLTVTNDLQVNGNVTLGNATSDTVTINGDLIVSGSQTTKVSETVLVEDNIITLNSNEAGTPSENSGIEVERGTAANVALRWNETNDYWELTEDGTNYFRIQTLGSTSWAGTIGDGSATSYNIDNTGASAPNKNHGLGTDNTKFMIQLIDVSSGETVHADVVRDTVTGGRVTISFTTAPTTDDIRVLITKIG